MAAPIILILLRLLQGLALGGEYGGAATYVAEHAPDGKRGLYTSWIQTTATMGLFLSLLVILACRASMSTESFDAWGWRIPFLLSIVLLAISVYIRLQLQESPVFAEIKAEGKLSKAPLTEAFGQWGNLKIVLLALFGATAGQAVVWYGGQFYALFFLEKILQVDGKAANIIMAVALLIATPFFVVFGALVRQDRPQEDRTRGMFASRAHVLPDLPRPHALRQPGARRRGEDFAGRRSSRIRPSAASSSIRWARSSTRAAATCQGRAGAHGCVVFERARSRGCPPRSCASATTVVEFVEPANAGPMSAAEYKKAQDEVGRAAQGRARGSRVSRQGEHGRAQLPDGDPAVLTMLVIYVTMVYGPIAAWLVELFPARIRYTSMSLPYHIGNGWFGGFLPVTSFAIVAATGNIYNGLWYPVVVAIITIVIGGLFLRETKDSPA